MRHIITKSLLNNRVKPLKTFSFKTYLENKEEVTKQYPINKWIELTDDDKIKFGNDLIKLVGIAYANTILGSFIKNQNDVNASNWIVFNNKDNVICCAIFYRQARANESWIGNKIQGLGHDGDVTSRRMVVMHLKDILEQNGWWIECRAAVAKALHRAGASVVKDESLAAAIFPNTGLHMTDNNGSYTRHIAGRGTALTDETIFGKPVLKHVGIREYIAEFENGDMIPTIMPSGATASISSHFSDRADLRTIKDDRLVQILTQAAHEFASQLDSMGNNHKFLIVAPDFDLGIVKQLVKDNTGKEHYNYIIMTVHKTLYLKYVDDKMDLDSRGYTRRQDVLRLSDAKNKKIELSKAEVDRGDKSQYTRPSKVLTFNDSKYWYSITRGELIALGKNIPTTKYKVGYLIRQANAIANTEPPGKRKYYTEVASLTDTVYVAKINNSNVILVDGVFTVVLADQRKQQNVNVKLIPIAQFAEHAMHLPPNGNTVAENTFKKYLGKLEAQNPALSITSILVEEPAEDQLLISVETLKEHFRMLEGSIDKSEDGNLIIKIGDLAEKYECSLDLIKIKLRHGIKIEMAQNKEFKTAKLAALRNLNKSINFYKENKSSQSITNS